MVPSVALSSRSISSFLRLTRIWNLLIIGVAQYFTAIFLIDPQTFNDLRLLLLSISTMAITAAGYIINDYYDVKIDFVNKPGRVVVGKGITRRFALLFHIVLSAGGIALGFYLSWWIGLINILAAFLLWVYSNSLKRLPFIGNLAVALLTGLSILVVDVLYPPHHNLIWIYAVFAFFMSLVREIVKDMKDLKGDNSFGCRTLPIVWGIRRTKWFIYFILSCFVVMILLINDHFQSLPFIYFLLFLFLPLLVLVVWLYWADTKRAYALLSTFSKIILVLGIISMAFVS